MPYGKVLSGKGLLSLVLEHNPLYSPLALIMIGGLISSALLTCTVTLVLYKLLPPKVLHDDKRKMNVQETGELGTE